MKRKIILLPTRESGELIYITPSKPNPWRAHRVDGKWYTHYQARWMHENDKHPDTVDTHIVHSVASEREWCRGFEPAPAYEIKSPVVARTSDGKRIRIIAPDGSEIWVVAGGSTKNWRWMTPRERNALYPKPSAAIGSRCDG